MKRRDAIGGMLGGTVLALAPRPAPAAETVRMAVLPIDTDAQVYYAADLGYFQDAGIDAQIEVIQAGSTVVAAIVGGSIDIGFTNPISLAAAHQHGVPIVAIASGGIYAQHTATAAIVVPKNSPIKEARDFHGKTMACSGLKTVGQWAPAAWIDKNGGDSRQVQFVEMPFPDMPLALAQGRVDSAFPAEPFITLAKDVSRVFVDAYAAIAPQFTIGIWVTSSQWADAHRPVVEKFAQVIAKTSIWANANRPQSAAILAKYGKLDPAVVKSMLRVRYPARFVPSDMQPIIDLAAHYGALPASIPADQLVYKT